MGQSNASRTVALCAVFLIAALYVVGVVSHGVLRHVVQTAPVPRPSFWVSAIHVGPNGRRCLAFAAGCC
jgi:hypothetical protein